MMSIPRKNPRTVISEEQKKLTEDTTAQISTQPGSQGASSTDSINDTKDQSSRSNNDANSINNTNQQNTQSASSTDSINDTKDQSSRSNNDANSINIQSTQSANSTNGISNTKDQNNDTATTMKPVPLQTSRTKKPHAQSTIETSSTTFEKLQNKQSDKGEMSIKSQSAMSTKDTNTQSTEDREREVYYLTPSQVDKLDDLRIAYRKATGRRLNKQDFMRYIVDSLDLNMLV